MTVGSRWTIHYGSCRAKQCGRSSVCSSSGCCCRCVTRCYCSSSGYSSSCSSYSSSSSCCDCSCSCSCFCSNGGACCGRCSESCPSAISSDSAYTITSSGGSCSCSCSCNCDSDTSRSRSRSSCSRYGRVWRNDSGSDGGRGGGDRAGICNCFGPGICIGNGNSRKTVGDSSCNCGSTSNGNGSRNCDRSGTSRSRSSYGIELTGNKLNSIRAEGEGEENSETHFLRLLADHHGPFKNAVSESLYSG